MFHGKRHPQNTGAAEVEVFLTHTGVDVRVLASTQNQLCRAVSRQQTANQLKPETKANVSTLSLFLNHAGNSADDVTYLVQLWTPDKNLKLADL
ncbi:MAG: hypothetical protein PHI13_01130 [Methylococcales bacterium]|nr:hypothetical protein [Methylococcales bacterium]